MDIGILLFVAVELHSRVPPFVTSETVAHQALLSMGFSRQEYWSGSPFPSPRHLPNPGIEPSNPVLTGGFFTSEPPWKPLAYYNISQRAQLPGGSQNVLDHQLPITGLKLSLGLGSSLTTISEN